MYLTYDEYLNMGGTMDSTTFDELDFEAESIINLYTYNRLHNDVEFSDNVKRCVYALIKLVQSKSTLVPKLDANGNVDATSAGITSQSNDGVSISYNVLSATEIVGRYTNDIKSIISQYLAWEVNSLGHRLLFKGLYSDE